MTIMGWTLYAYEQAIADVNNLAEARMWMRIGADYVFASWNPQRREYVGMMGIAENVDFLWQGPPEEWVAGQGCELELEDRSLAER